MTFEQFCEKEIAPVGLLKATQPYALQLLQKAYEKGQADIINKLKEGDIPGYQIIETKED